MRSWQVGSQYPLPASARSRNKVACRLHARLCELLPGGYAGEIYASRAARLLDDFVPAGAVQAARRELALELLEDLRRLDEQLRASRNASPRSSKLRARA